MGCRSYFGFGIAYVGMGCLCLVAGIFLGTRGANEGSGAFLLVSLLWLAFGGLHTRFLVWTVKSISDRLDRIESLLQEREIVFLEN